MMHLKKIVIVAMVLNILLIIIVVVNKKVHNHEAFTALGLAFITLTFTLSILLHRHATSLKSRTPSNSNRSIKL